MGVRRIVFVCVVAGCLVGGATAEAAIAGKDKPDPAGFHRVTIRAAAMSMAVKDGWLAFDPTSTSFSESLQAAAAANPQLQPLIAQFKSEASSVKFFAVAPTGDNVLVLPLPIDKSQLSDPEAVASALRGQIPNIAVKKGTIAGKHGLVAVATLDLRRSDGSPYTAHATLYLVPTKNGVVDLDFTTSDDGRQDPTVQTTVRSLRFLR